MYIAEHVVITSTCSTMYIICKTIVVHVHTLNYIITCIIVNRSSSGLPVLSTSYISSIKPYNNEIIIIIELII